MVRPLILFLFLVCQSHADIEAIYLSWYADPATTMTIQWITQENETDDTIYLQSSDDSWTPLTGSHKPLHYFLVHQAHLSSLLPDTEYQFRIGEESLTYTFKTAPQQLNPNLRFVIGGDAYLNKKLFRKMNQTIVKKEPLFCVIGGDIAYAIDVSPSHFFTTPLKRWIAFLSEWTKQMVTPNGRLIPFILGAGNHDIDKAHSEIFFTLFAFPEQRLYRTLDFGNYLSLIFLDTNHFDPIEGEQTTWLKETLSNHRNIPTRFAIYHESAYPSFYSFEGTTPKQIRALWCPLFDQYNLSAAFENHNHAFKKTYPLRNNAIDYENGMIYFGDGCWGAPPRRTKDMWYLDKRARKNNVYLIDLTETEAKIQAIDLSGESLDSVTLTVQKTN